ncbi:RNA polymerase sigma factor [Paenibacillus ihuae]|uniref:RNA polymerase sigma factor n=1 Tax=Paenibacillus ihuae TaxID=1232431 RepID=UPI0006D56E30|nr:RNA polymerase sigma factor [Paenibacillus ihuae]
MEQGNPGGQVNPNMIEEAINKVCAGERQAFTMLITAYERQIYTYCYYILRSREEAEDAVQDVFVKVYQELGRYERRGSFSAWVYKVAYHHCLDQLRRRTRRSRLLSLYKMQLVRDYPEFKNDSPVDRLFADLTSEESGLLILHVIEQYSFEEIAQITGRSSAALRKKYERLRKKLIQQKEDEGGYHHGEMAESK